MPHSLGEHDDAERRSPICRLIMRTLTLFALTQTVCCDLFLCHDLHIFIVLQTAFPPIPFCDYAQDASQTTKVH